MRNYPDSYRSVSSYVELLGRIADDPASAQNYVEMLGAQQQPEPQDLVRSFGRMLIGVSTCDDCHADCQGLGITKLVEIGGNSPTKMFYTYCPEGNPNSYTLHTLVRDVNGALLPNFISSTYVDPLNLHDINPEQ